MSVNAVLSHPSTPSLLSHPSSSPLLPSSLLCTVDDSDPGQSSETWGERLVPPCRIYAGNRCSPILRTVSTSSHSALLLCCRHTCTCVCFRLASASITAQHVMCLVNADRPETRRPDESRLRLVGLRECCLFIHVFFFQTSCLSSVFLRDQQIQGEEENVLP